MGDAVWVHPGGRNSESLVNSSEYLLSWVWPLPARTCLPNTQGQTFQLHTNKWSETPTSLLFASCLCFLPGQGLPTVSVLTHHGEWAREAVGGKSVHLSCHHEVSGQLGKLDILVTFTCEAGQIILTSCLLSPHLLEQGDLVLAKERVNRYRGCSSWVANKIVLALLMRPVAGTLSCFSSNVPALSTKQGPLST